MSGRRRLEDIIASAEVRGWSAVRKSKSICLKHPNGGMYHVHLTNSDWRALTHVEKALSRIEAGRPAGAH